MSNKGRNRVAVVAIVLTTVLFTTMFTLGMGMLQAIQGQTMRQVGTSAHAGFKYLNQKQYEDIVSHPLVKESGYSRVVGIAENHALIKRSTEIRYATEEVAKWGFCEPTVGRLPEKLGELATDTIVLDSLGIPYEIGTPIHLEYSVDGELRNYDFVLSGYWDGDIVQKASMAYVSKNFIEKELGDIDLLEQQKKQAYGGLYFPDVMFNNSRHIEENVQEILTDLGYENISYGVNWAFMSESVNMDLSFILTVAIAQLIILSTGYLIIFNIFYIAVTKEITYYGLLKTIGTTGAQIKRLVMSQVYILSLIGIPIGLLCGFILGNLLMPTILNITSLEGLDISITPQPVIFIGASIFSWVTVYISCKKPSKIAAKVSPIEAIRHSDASVSRKIKRGYNGAKVSRMAWNNVFRNRKKASTVIMSITLGLTLLNSVATMITAFDMDQYLENRVVSDFVVGQGKYFSQGYRGTEDALPVDIIEEVSSRKGIEGSGSVYYKGFYQHELSAKGKETIKYLFNDDYINSRDEYEKIELEEIRQTGKLILETYGINKYLATKVEIVKGEFDLDEFMTGKYIIMDQPTRKAEYPELDSIYNINDEVKIVGDDGLEQTYTVMAIGYLPYNISRKGSFLGGVKCYIPTKKFKELIMEPSAINYVFDVDDNQNAMVENFLNDYMNNEPLMGYESKATYIEEFRQLIQTYTLTGGALCLIIGLIGILNFFNSTVTGIISRRREFALLHSVGMTSKQVVRMLILEGLYVVAIAVLLSLTLGNILTFAIVDIVVGQMWFINYHFIIWPIVLVTPFLVLLSVLLPLLSHMSLNRDSIVKQLNEYS